ncbi:MAG: DUF1538 domain-containing protein [Gammaproteobacteria bacterium]|nr:DUF1538 domain-containing protein [Gammaproteobacteria bacterium]
MIELFGTLLQTLLGTIRDVVPITLIILCFQFLVIRRPLSHWRQLLMGYGYVILGLALFLMGLEKALFPLGSLMAEQLTAPEFLSDGLTAVELTWRDYYWVYLFGGAIGFATTLAEPALIAVALMARDVSGGAISPLGLRMSVSLGVALGIALGTLRIVCGWPLHYFIISGYVIVLLQTLTAPKIIIGLAYDSGGVTTSTVTVPLVTALGLGLAANVPGRDPLLDGFGLIAFASLFPIISVLGYAEAAELLARYVKGKTEE